MRKTAFAVLATLLGSARPVAAQVAVTPAAGPPALASAASEAGPDEDHVRAVLAYYRRHYPAYYEKHYAHLERGAPPPAPPPEEPDATPVGGMVGGEDALTGARTLRGHTFPLPRLVPGGAFAASSFYVGTSVEFYRQPEVTAPETAGEPGEPALTYDRNLAFIRLRYGVDFAVHERVAFGLDADYLAMVGANESSVLLYGGQTGFDFRPHLRGVVLRDPDGGSQLALSGYGTFESGVRAIPQGLLNELAAQLEAIADDTSGERASCLAEGDVDCALDGDLTSSLALTRHRRGGGGAVTFAQALGSALGVQMGASFEAAHKSIDSQVTSAATATDLRLGAGIAPSLDLGPDFPVGAALAYRFEWQRSQYAENQELGIARDDVVVAMYHRTSAGLYYTGRRDLMLGWTGGVAFLGDGERGLSNPAAGTPSGAALTPQPDAMLFSGHFDLRYFF